MFLGDRAWGVAVIAVSILLLLYIDSWWAERNREIERQSYLNGALPRGLVDEWKVPPPSPLTDEEKETMASIQGTFTHFYEKPSMEDYEKLRAHDNLLVKAMGEFTVTLYISAIKVAYAGLLDLSPGKGDEKLIAIVLDRLMNQGRTMAASDLDLLWIIFHATGIEELPRRVMEVFLDEKQHMAVRTSALWSYNSHVDQGYSRIRAFDPKNQKITRVMVPIPEDRSL